MYRAIVFTLGLCVVLTSSESHAETNWNLKGELAESCCCQKVCPCVFNEAPTLGHCEGSSLFEIEEGNYGDVSVDGLKTVFSYNFGNWVRVYVEESATDEQVDAVVNLLSQDETFGAFFAGDAKLLSAEQTEVTVEKTDSTIAFSVPDATVRLEAVAGEDGEPVRIENLTIPWFTNGYAQYLTTTTSHERDGVSFEYSGTNGATSAIDASGVDAD